MSMSSDHTKVKILRYYLTPTRPTPSTFQKALEALHPNIACMRHPDHIGSKGVWVHFNSADVLIC
jgi:hypothetical protein